MNINVKQGLLLVFKYVEENNSAIERVTFNGNTLDWDMSADSQLSRRSVWIYADSMVGRRLGYPVGWFNLAMLQLLKTSDLPPTQDCYIEIAEVQEHIKTTVNDWLVMHRVFVNLNDPSEPKAFFLSGNEEHFNDFYKFIQHLTHSYGWLPDWFVIECRNIKKSAKELPSNFQNANKKSVSLVTTTALNQLSEIATQLGVSIYYKDNDGDIDFTTNIVEKDREIGSRIESIYTQVISDLRASIEIGESAYHNIVFDIEDDSFVKLIVENVLKTYGQQIIVTKDGSVTLENGGQLGNVFTNAATLNLLQQIPTIFDGERIKGVLYKTALSSPREVPTDTQAKAVHISKGHGIHDAKSVAQRMRDLNTLFTNVVSDLTVMEPENAAKTVGELIYQLTLECDDLGLNLFSAFMSRLSELEETIAVPDGNGDFLQVDAHGKILEVKIGDSQRPASDQ